MICEKASINDLESLVALRMAYLLEDGGTIPEDTYRMIEGRLPAYFQKHLNEDLLAFVCRQEGEIAGCCFLYISEKPSNPAFPSGKTGTVLNVYTRPEFRKKGIAGQLMEMLLKESAQMGLDFVELKATDSGYSLYKKIGFEDVHSKYHPMKYVLKTRSVSG